MPVLADSAAVRLRSSRLTQSFSFIRWRCVPAEYRRRLQAQGGEHDDEKPQRPSHGPSERAVVHKIKGDAAFKAKRYRDAYAHYDTAIEALSPRRPETPEVENGCAVVAGLRATRLRRAPDLDVCDANGHATCRHATCRHAGPEQTAARVLLRADDSAYAPMRAKPRKLAAFKQVTLAPSGAISKQQHSKAAARPSPASAAKLIPLTRSTSDRAGLLSHNTNSLAVEAALGASNTKRTALPLRRAATSAIASVDAGLGASSETKLSALPSEIQLPALPLIRSAASELATTIASEMRL